MKEVIKARDIKHVDMTQLRMKSADEINESYDLCIRLIDSVGVGTAQAFSVSFMKTLSTFKSLGLITWEQQENLEKKLVEDMERKIERIYKRIGE